VRQPVVYTGKPRVPEKYDVMMVDGINVYIYKGTETAPAGIKIIMGSWRGIPVLEVEGVNY